LIDVVRRTEASQQDKMRMPRTVSFPKIALHVQPKIERWKTDDGLTFHLGWRPPL